ncbi:MAG: uroporphyrinogen decarboxylase family protein [Candidatus Hydrogenedentales bacterium]|jgi:hypothetical protein
MSNLGIIPATATQLRSYIAPGAPATRCVANGTEPFIRPEIGFTPKWYRDALGISFGERWHVNPEYRRESIVAMRAELHKRFPGANIGGCENDGPLDLLTGTFGACVVASLYGASIHYQDDNWPVAEHLLLSDEEIDALSPPDLESNPFFQALLEQVEWIAQREGRVVGYINWQGILNNAHRLRGETLLLDLLAYPERCHHLFDCVCTTMVNAAKILHARQRASGFDVQFFTVSNCLVNLVSGGHYRDLLLPYDIRIAEAFDCIGIHNCAWCVDPYIDPYAEVPRVGYVDMGVDSDLPRIRATFPAARRAVMYRPTDLASRGDYELRDDMRRIARDLGPCDIVAADIESDTPDEKVLALIDVCRRLSAEFNES